LLGLAFTDSDIYAVLAKGTFVKGSIKKKVSEKLPEGAVKGGVIVDTKKVVEVLCKIQKVMGTSRVAICLPPELVYCTHCTVTPEHSLEAAVEQNIPEKLSALRYWTKTYKDAQGKKQVGILAVRKDVLQGISDACRKAGFRVVSITSLSLSLAGRGSSLVVSGSSLKPTLTIFYNGWPIDEAVLPQKASDDEIVEELREFMEEYREEYPVDSIHIVVTPGLFKTIKKSQSSLSVSQLLSWISEKDMSLLGAIAASLVGSGRFNLLRTQKNRNAVLWLALLFVLMVCAGVVVYVRPDLVPQLFWGKP